MRMCTDAVDTENTELGHALTLIFDTGRVLCNLRSALGESFCYHTTSHIVVRGLAQVNVLLN